MRLDPNLLRSIQPLSDIAGNYPATTKAHGLFQTFQFVLRLSPEVHRKLAGNSPGIVSGRDVSFEHAQAFSTYANNIAMLASTVDREFATILHPKEWSEPFRQLEAVKEQGFYYGSPVQLWPLGAREVLEGQACFCQIQYLHFGSGGRLEWDDFKEIGILHGMYQRAFEVFLEQAGLDWPPSVNHPTVGLFLAICDMAINSGSGFPHRLIHFPSFITDTDPASRFTMLSGLVRLRCPEVAEIVCEYTKDEYVALTARLSAELIVDTPMEIAETFAGWAAPDGPFAPLMEEYRTFNFEGANLPVRVMFSHFLAFMRDKLASPEIFCWPGAWMAGSRVHPGVATLFERHSALFVDKEDDDGVFPRLIEGKDEAAVHETFQGFYAANLTYDMTDQWIQQPGPFTYDFRWLSASGEKAHMKEYADRHFEQVYGVRPDAAKLLSK